MSKLLDGKTAIVTGASQGLGLAISTALCTDGASVLMVARDEQKLAEAAAGYPGKGVAAVYASPMERARETASPIARALGLKVRAARGLNECQFGSWTGRRLGDLAKLKAWATVQGQPSTFRFPGGESFAEMQARITGQVVELVALHPGRTIVCVSHADPIKAALASALGTPLDLFQRIVVGPASVSMVLYTPERPMVLTVNSTSPPSGPDPGVDR